jgi:hypothetical protein
MELVRHLAQSDGETLVLRPSLVGDAAAQVGRHAADLFTGLEGDLPTLFLRGAGDVLHAFLGDRAGLSGVVRQAGARRC